MIQVADFHKNCNHSVASLGQNTKFHEKRSREVENMSKN